MPFDYLISAFVTLLVVVDPIGLAPVFAGLTAGLPRRAQRQVAQRACLIAGAVLFGTALIGDALLRGLGITPSAFEIAGGLLLFLVATEMVLGTRLQEQSKTAEQAIEDHVRNIAAFPIAIPLMAGPGAIAATILLSAAAYTTVMWALLILVIIAVCGITFLVFISASEISRFLGITGNVVLSRLLGMILAALAVQYVIDGIRAVIVPGSVH
jgi:multiple antibiotic resistance protein